MDNDLISDKSIIELGFYSLPGDAFQVDTPFFMNVCFFNDDTAIEFLLISN